MELLVALTLFSFLVSGIITFVISGLEVTKKTEGQLSVQQDRNEQERQLENALIFPVERVDTGVSSVATTSGAIFQIDGTSIFIGTQSMTGTCT